MISDCEICERKQVPCKSCEESQRAICYRCDGDVDDPYCEVDEGEANNPDYAEILRLIRKHMRPGDTLGKMFMRIAKDMEIIERVLVPDWEDVEQLTNVGAWCDACQTTHWSGQCDPDLDQQRIHRS